MNTLYFVQMSNGWLIPEKHFILYTVLCDPEQIFTISGSGGSEEADMMVDNNKVMLYIFMFAFLSYEKIYKNVHTNLIRYQLPVHNLSKEQSHEKVC
jgi:hypothetical protein